MQQIPLLRYKDLATSSLAVSHDKFYDIISPSVRKEQEDFCEHNPEEKMESFFFGWKLHISVKGDQLERAFDTIAPILMRRGVPFKVLNTRGGGETFSKRFQNGTQFTIYLEKWGKAVLSCQEVKEMIEEINAALVGTGISRSSAPHSAEEISTVLADAGIVGADIEHGTRPRSDAKIAISPYFSLRNDKALAPAIFHLPEDFRYLSTYDDSYTYVPKAAVDYMDAEEIGTSFNPCNLNNPYSSLLSEECRRPFNLIGHFRSLEDGSLPEELPLFDKQNKYLLHKALTLFAYLYEHTRIEEFSGGNLLELRELIYSGQPIPTEFIKPTSTSEPNIQENIRWAFMICDYLSSRGSRDKPEDKFNTGFPLIPQGDLSDFIKIIYENLGPFQESDTGTVHLTKHNFEQQKETFLDLLDMHKNKKFDLLAHKSPAEIISEMTTEMRNPNPIVAMVAVEILYDKLGDNTEERQRIILNNLNIPAVAIAAFDHDLLNENSDNNAILHAMDSILSATNWTWSLLIDNSLERDITNLLKAKYEAGQREMAITGFNKLAEHGSLSAQLRLVEFFRGNFDSMDPINSSLAEVSYSGISLGNSRSPTESNFPETRRYLEMAIQNPMVTQAGKEKLQDVLVRINAEETEGKEFAREFN